MPQIEPWMHWVLLLIYAICREAIPKLLQYTKDQQELQMSAYDKLIVEMKGRQDVLEAALADCNRKHDDCMRNTLDLRVKVAILTERLDSIERNSNEPNIHGSEGPIMERGP